MVFSIVTGLCNCHCSLLPEHSYHHKGNSPPLSCLSRPSAPGSHWSFCFCALPFLDLIDMESYDICYFFHSAQCFLGLQMLLCISVLAAVRIWCVFYLFCFSNFPLLPSFHLNFLDVYFSIVSFLVPALRITMNTL